MPSIASENGTVAVGRPPTDSGVFQTSPGLLRRRVLGPWSEGLQQYLAIRLGDGARGRAAFRMLMRMVDSLPPEELLQPPGPKAQLYRLARSVAETERAMPGGAGSGSLRWRSTDRRGLDRLRQQLSPRCAEILELRHARELSLGEIAFILELAPEDAELRLDTAAAHARKILGGVAPDLSREHATVYVEAFALARSWNDLSGGPSDDAEGLDPGTLIGGRYQLVERVGVGAFGDVYRAEDIEVRGHQVALKMLRQPSLSSSARQAALRELKLNAAVFHPSLVQFKDHGWFDERLWFVMPWYEGETLEARMRRGALSRPEAKQIFVPLARALAALHTVGIRHQDIKPENVLLTELPGEEGVLPILIDLGVAAEEQETTLGGTPLYFAPEVAERFASPAHSGREVSGAADVFALALSLRNALEPGTQPDVPAGAVKAFVERRAEQMPPLPEARDLRFLSGTFRRWMSLDPEERPSAAEFAEELAVLTEPEERRERRWKLLRWFVPLLITLAAIFSGVVYVMDQRAERGEHEARRAQRAASDARADFIVSDARRRSLEEGHDALLTRYRESRLSRSQLASQLATSDGQLRIVHGDLSAALGARSAVEGRLRSSRTRLHEQGEILVATELARDEARRDLSRLRASLATARERSTRIQQERDAARARATELSASLSQATARAHALEVELATAREARESASAELARVRARVAALAAVLEAPEPPRDAEPAAPQAPE